VKNVPAERAIFDISKCKSTETGNLVENLPLVISSEGDIDPSTGAGFKIVLNLKESSMNTGIYICDFVVRDSKADRGNSAYEYAKKPSIVNVVS
jgi:hypothetical protein